MLVSKVFRGFVGQKVDTTRSTTAPMASAASSGTRSSASGARARQRRGRGPGCLSEEKQIGPTTLPKERSGLHGVSSVNIVVLRLQKCF